MVNENGYDINEAGDAKPWGALDMANFGLLFNMMPTRGTSLVDTVTVPNPHKHARLFDENEAQRLDVTSTKATLSFGATGAVPVASSSFVLEKAGDNTFSMLAPNANINRIAMGVLADNDWFNITSDYTAGTVRIERGAIGLTLGAESVFIDNHNDNVNPINGVNGVNVSTNLVTWLTPAGGASSFLVLTHVDFSNGGASGGRTELFLGTSDLTGAGSLLSLGTRNDSAGGPAGYGAFSFISNAVNHISFEWTANAVGQTARVYARVIMFPFIT